MNTSACFNLKRAAAPGVCVVVAFLLGCEPRQQRGPFDPWMDSTPPHVESAEAVTGTAAVAESVGAPPELPDDAGVKAYVALALRRNPAIRAAGRKVARLWQRVPQVRSLEDPVFMVAPAGEMAETAAGMVGLTAGMSQTLPLPAKLDARGRIAAQEAAVATAELKQTRISVAADTRRAFWSYYFATRGLEVIEVDRKLIGQFRQVAESKYKSGTATQQDVLRASVELSNLDNRLITLRQQQTSAVAMLNRQLDRPIDAPLPRPRPVKAQSIALRLEALLAEAWQSNPQLAAVHRRIEAQRQRLRLARLQRWPDLTVSVNYAAVEDEGHAVMPTGDDQWWVGLGINLPIWLPKLKAAEQEAREGIFEGLAELNSEQNAVAFRVQDALVKVETQQRLTTLFRDVIVPQARQTVEVSASGYRAGSVSFLTLVDNWRKLLDFELLYHMSLAQLEQHFAELQHAVGRDVARTRDATPHGQQDSADVRPPVKERDAEVPVTH